MIIETRIVKNAAMIYTYTGHCLSMVSGHGCSMTGVKGIECSLICPYPVKERM